MSLVVVKYLLQSVRIRAPRRAPAREPELGPPIQNPNARGPTRKSGKRRPESGKRRAEGGERRADSGGPKTVAGRFPLSAFRFGRIGPPRWGFVGGMGARLPGVPRCGIAPPRAGIGPPRWGSRKRRRSTTHRVARAAAIARLSCSASRTCSAAHRGWRPEPLLFAAKCEKRAVGGQLDLCALGWLVLTPFMRNGLESKKSLLK